MGSMWYEMLGYEHIVNNVDTNKRKQNTIKEWK